MGCLALILIMLFGAWMSLLSRGTQALGSMVEKASSEVCKEQWLALDDQWSRLNNRPVNSGPIPQEIYSKFQLEEEQLKARCGPRP
jgi:chorismate-pyruvate lyase